MTAIYVGAAGAITPLGHDVERTIASLRSGLDRFKQIPFMGAEGEDLKAAPIDGYAEGVTAVDRYEALVLKAILPCLQGLSHDERERTGILLGLPRSDRAGAPPELATALRRRVANRLGISPRVVHPVELGRASVFASLRQAELALEQGRLAHCIIGGVDTLVNGNSLRALSESGQIKEQWDGIIPGEAAAFVRVSLAPTVGPWGVPSSIIRGIGTATDPADGSAADPLVGVGVNEAFRNAIRDAGATDGAVHLYINDLNGTRAGFEDAAMGYIRFFRSPREHLELWHVASYMGETGAAVGAIELIWACAALELGFAPGPGVMLGASDGQVRTAVFMSKGPGPTSHRPHRRVGTSAPVLHELAVPTIESSHDDPGLRLAGEDLHSDLLWQNFQELNWLWAVREQHHAESGDRWIAIEDFERRLVAHLDAIVWSGRAGLRFAAGYLLSEDMDEAAAAALVLLSFSSNHPSLRSKLQEAILESEKRRQAIVAVLPHMPPQTTDPILHWMTSSNEPVLVAAGLRALAIAGRVTEEIVRPLLGTREPLVIAELVHAAGTAGLTQTGEDLCVLVERGPDVRIMGVGFVALLSIAPTSSLRAVISAESLALEMPVAAALIALRDGTSFFRFLPPDQISNPAAIEACGWCGEQAARPLLLKILESGEPTQKSAAANALHRIYGLSCYEEVKVQKSASAPEDEELASNVVKRLSQDPAVWEDALGGFDRQRRGDGRLRHGVPWSRRAALDHLKRTEAAFAERIVAAWEYALVNRAPLPCYPSLFVQRQRDALSTLESNAPI